MFVGWQLRNGKWYKRWLNPTSYVNDKKKNRIRRHQQVAEGKGSRNHIALLLSAARNRAKTRGLPFTLTAADIMVPDVCPVFGTPLKRNLKGSGHTADSPSLDRLVPELGYVPGNVRIISLRANRIKNDASPQELRQVADWFETELRASSFMP